MRAHLIILLVASLMATPALAAKKAKSKGRAPKTESIALVEPPPVEGVSAKAIKWSAYFAKEGLEGQGFRLIAAKQVALAHAKKKLKVPACNEDLQCLAGIGQVASAGYVANVTVRPAGKQLGVKLTLVDTAEAKIISNIFSLVINDEPATLRQAIKKQIPRATAALKKHVAEKAAAAAAIAEAAPAAGDQPAVVSLTKPAADEPAVVSLTKPADKKPADEPAVVSLTKPADKKPADEPAVVSLTKPADKKPADEPAVVSLTKPADKKPADEPAVVSLTKPADKKPSQQPAVAAVAKPAEEPAVVAIAKPIEDLSQAVVAVASPSAEVKPGEPAVKVIEAAGDAPKALTKVAPSDDDKVVTGPIVAKEPFRVPKFVPYTLIGVGAVATGLGVGLFGQEARTATADYQAGRDPSAARELAKSKAMYTDISAGAGIALMATGGILMLFTGDEPASADARTVSVSPTANGAAVSGSF